MSPYIIPGLKYKTLPPGGRSDLKRIVDLVIDNNGFGITEADLLKKCRKREMVQLRQVSIWAMTKMTGASLKTIGEYFNRDHTTVIHSRDTVNDLIYSKEPSIMRLMEKIKVYL